MEPLERRAGVHVRRGGRRLLSFAGCDSLGLALHPRVLDAARRGLSVYGVGIGASRTTTGTARVHRDLEEELARWLEAPESVLTASGYLAGAVALAALAPGADGIFLDRGAHPALASAARASGLPVVPFDLFQAGALERTLERTRVRRPIVAVDAIDVPGCRIAPLQAIGGVVQAHRGVLVVDDAHGIGALGPNGRGVLASSGAAGAEVVLTGSLSKALGAHGGFVAGSREFCQAARRTGAYGGATPIPPALAAAALAAVNLAAGPDGEKRRRALQLNVQSLTAAWTMLGLPTPADPVPWFVLGRWRGEEAAAAERRLVALSRSFARVGLLVPHVSYGGRPPGGFLRVSVSALHRRTHLETLTRALAARSPCRRPFVK